jgi:hypothetical protein
MEHINYAIKIHPIVTQNNDTAEVLQWTYTYGPSNSWTQRALH